MHTKQCTKQQEDLLFGTGRLNMELGPLWEISVQQVRQFLVKCGTLTVFQGLAATSSTAFLILGLLSFGPTALWKMSK